MTINIIQTIINTLDVDRQVINSNITETYVLSPDEGKSLQNIKTGKIFNCSMSIGPKANLKNYIEIDKIEE